MNSIPASQAKGKWWHIAIIIVVVLAAYIRVFHAPFSTWDDQEQIVNNMDIRGLGWSNIVAWFSHFYISEYQPVSMAGYAVDFALGSSQPFVYHFTDIILHILNAVILYCLIIKIQKNVTIAFFVALIFALHPVQTENVSWVAEQKTVLCGSFYLLTLLSYVLYTTRPSTTKLIWMILFGIAAMLSKAIAVTLPVTMIAVHFLMMGKFTWKRSWLPVILLFLVSLVIGVVAIFGQASGHWLNRHPKFNHWDTILIASQNYTQYIFHLIVPYHLSVIYPYPSVIGFVYYFIFAITVAIILLAVLAWRKKWHILFGGIFFYTINIVMLLQLFVQYGDYMMGDRFLYIASIGIILPLVYYPFNWLQERKKQAVAILLYTLVTLTLFVYTFIRNDIWLSELNFLTSILEDMPASAVAQYSVGTLYLNNGDYANAETHINEAVRLDTRNYKAWYDKGVLSMRENNMQDALIAFDNCLALYPYPDAYFNRAMLYMITNNISLALVDAERDLLVQPGNARAWYIKGYCVEQEGNPVLAIECCNKAIALEHNEPLFYILRGQAYAKMNQCKEGLDDMNRAIILDPSNGKAYYSRAVIKKQLGQDLCSDLHTATAKGYNVPAEMAAACNGK